MWDANDRLQQQQILPGLDECRKRPRSISPVDVLIAKHARNDKPDVLLAVTCGVIHIADQTITAAFSGFQTALEKGKIQPSNDLNNIVDVVLINDGLKYKVQATKSGPNTYFLVMNNSYREVDIHRQSDASLLHSLDGGSYTTYMGEEVDRCRIVVGNQTYIFNKGKAPSLLCSPCAGKLIEFLIEDGGHVEVGQAYAKIEVTRIEMDADVPCTTLEDVTVGEAGRVFYKKCRGDVLEAETLIAHLELDDPTLVTQPQDYTGQFPTPGISAGPEKLNHIHSKCRAALEKILAGYCLPDPYHSRKLRELIEEFMNSLRDPTLPLFELREVIDTISGRIPISVEKKIRELMADYERNITSLLLQFPSQQIVAVIDGHAATLSKLPERDSFFLATEAIVLLVQRYRNGIRGHMKTVIHELLRQYHTVESQFKQGNYDRCVSVLIDQFKNDMTMVTSTIFSHSQVTKKNILVQILIDNLGNYECGIIDEVANTLTEFTSLHPRTMQVLKSAHKRAYEFKHDQMESIFLSAIEIYDQNYDPENIQKLILSKACIFDTLYDFFYHTNRAVRNAALEVYVRRAYIIYELSWLQHLKLSGEIPLVLFHFLLPNNHTDHQNQALVKHRTGAMAAFQDLDHFKKYADEVLDLFKDMSSLNSGSAKVLEAMEPVHILIIAVVDNGNKGEKKVAKTFRDWVVSSKDKLVSRAFRRVTFLSLKERQFPKFFTFRQRDGFNEEKIYRHLEPGWAYHIELHRMRTYDLKALRTYSQKMHLYLGQAKGTKGKEITYYRFFIRSIIRHADLITKEASFYCLRNEGEQVFVEAMYELENAFLHPLARRTDCNHIFLNFVPTVIMDPARIEESFVSMVHRYGPRLWGLRVTEVEIKMTIRPAPGKPTSNFRLYFSYLSGCIVDLHLYTEAMDPKTGIIRFKSYAASRNHSYSKPGPMNGKTISTPYSAGKILK